MDAQTNLFQLTTEELALTNSLQQKIVNIIRNNNGQITVSKFMELALYDHEYGYYINLLHKFGRQGDFITAPLISELFASCIARQIQQLWLVSKECRHILEIGAGNGQLMLDLFEQLGNDIDCYYILELSSNLVQLQRQRLQTQYPQLYSKVVWLSELPTAFSGVILANEVLDAQPCEVVRWNRGIITQQMVSLDQMDKLIYTDVVPISEELLQIASQIPIYRDDYVSEINLNNRGFVNSLAATLECGFILLIDYGYGQNEYYAPERNNGTIRGFFRQHQLDDILYTPGLIDITASVDFTCIANTAIQSQLDFIGYTTQANFLFNCGLLDLITARREILSPVEAYKMNTQVNHLTSPNEMGDVFKVIGFSKNVDFCDWLGFSYNDRSHTL